MAWALWLAVPLGVTALASLASWWRGRPVRTPDPDAAMRAHAAYLDALTAPPRGSARVGSAGEADGADVAPAGDHGEDDRETLNSGR